ncbi:MAG: DUF1553 domain-containing protein [Prosthecobacter sp.]|uniref:DUF1553 domain-containing protein n=1 Tax=Prosthecobacter sp. TaxID=1965333 RepID=UPI003900126A
MLVLSSLLLATTSTFAVESDASKLFHEQVAPILVKNCIECHNDVTTKGSLNMETLAEVLKGGEDGPAIVPGKAQESPLYLMIVPESPGDKPEMPKKKAALTSAETDLIKRWIDMGAAWPQEIVLKEKPKGGITHWSLQPLKASKHGSIDAFIAEKLKVKGLAMNPPADARTFIRRASFDLIGLPPTPEEVREFVGECERETQVLSAQFSVLRKDTGSTVDKTEHSALSTEHFPPTAPTAVERLINRLLDSPRYGERWARHWLDVVRFAESHGFEMNRARANAWPYRDYVIRSLNADKPYDQFVREQIAGDQLGADEGTGFLVAGAWDQVKGQDPALRANQRADEMHDLVSTTGSTFLGLTIGCARCHDHKFDPVLQTDYYRVRAIFEGVQHAERELRPTDAEERQKKADGVRLEIAAIDATLARFQPKTQLTKRVLVDDDLPPPTKPDAIGCVQIEQPTNGKPIEYSPGAEFGQASDAGDSTRLPNLGESYRYWKAEKDEAEKDFFSWNPRVVGKQRLWLSWGAWTTHAKDARYILDLDGDANTKDDQQEIAVVDQSKFADGSGAIPEQKRWSGFKYAGTHALAAESIVILRSGKLGGPTVADAVLFEAADEAKPASQPHLRAPVTHLANRESFDAVNAKFVRFTIHATIGGQPCIDELEVFAGGKNVALSSHGAKVTASDVFADGANSIHQIAHANDGLYGNAKSWIARGAKGWLQLELPREEMISSVVWSRDRAEKGKAYQDRIPTDYLVEVSMDGKAWQAVASSADRLTADYRERIRDVPTLSGVSGDNAAEVRKHSERRAVLQREMKGLTSFPMAYLGKFEQPGATFRLHRGDPMTPKEEIAPGALSQLGAKLDLAKDTPESERRMALAKWLTDPQNLLTARVMVNRVWHYHFGTGIVDTPSDLGFNGGKPSHPELLDWLAAEFMKRDWSLKEMHRLIMNSAAYRQSSTANEAGMKADSGARLLWRFPTRRIEAEPLRDTILAVSGVLDLTMGGPGFDLFDANDNYVKVYQSKQEFGTDTFRRMIYQSKPRVQLDDTFGAFDVPDAGQIAPRRTSSTTPLQALNFLNSTFAMQQAGLFAQRLGKEAGAAAQVRRAFQLAYQREPRADELSASTKLIAEHGLAMFCRALFNTSEFMTLY